MPASDLSVPYLSKEMAREMRLQCYERSGRKGVSRIAVNRAVHYLRSEPVDGATIDRPIVMDVVACGYAVSDRKFTTKTWKEVSCLDCTEYCINHQDHN
jgi:hypothetical protein